MARTTARSPVAVRRILLTLSAFRSRAGARGEDSHLAVTVGRSTGRGLDTGRTAGRLASAPLRARGTTIEGHEDGAVRRDHGRTVVDPALLVLATQLQRGFDVPSMRRADFLRLPGDTARVVVAMRDLSERPVGGTTMSAARLRGKSARQKNHACPLLSLTSQYASAVTPPEMRATTEDPNGIRTGRLRLWRQGNFVVSPKLRRPGLPRVLRFPSLVRELPAGTRIPCPGRR